MAIVIPIRGCDTCRHYAHDSQQAHQMRCTRFGAPATSCVEARANPEKCADGAKWEPR